MKEQLLTNQIPFKRFSTSIDCSRNSVVSIDALKRWIDVTSKMGYNVLKLYTEDTYEIEGHPYFGYGRGRYSKAELKELNAYATENGAVKTLEKYSNYTGEKAELIGELYQMLLDGKDLSKLIAYCDDLCGKKIRV